MKRYELLHGDCIEILRNMPDKCFDCIVSDPPYGVGLQYDGYDDTLQNLQFLIDNALPEMRRVACRVILTCGIRNITIYPRPHWILGWFYHSTAFSPWGWNAWQPILVYGTDPDRRLRMRRPDAFYSQASGLNDGRPHPCPKPLSFMRKLINRVAPSRSDTILDPFCGSGTTGVAAIQLGHPFVGIEVNGDYLAIACRRIAAATPDFPHLIEGELHDRKAD